MLWRSNSPVTLLRVDRARPRTHMSSGATAVCSPAYCRLADPAGEKLVDTGHDKGGFGLLVRKIVRLYFPARKGNGRHASALSRAIRIVRNQLVRGFDDDCSASEVLGQGEPFGVEEFFEFVEICGRRSSKTEYGLIRIGHEHDIALRGAAHRPQNFELRPAGVLGFVKHDVLEHALIERGDSRPLDQQLVCRK